MQEFRCFGMAGPTLCGAFANSNLWDEASSSDFARVRSMTNAGQVIPRTFQVFADEKKRSHSVLGVYGRNGTVSPLLEASEGEGSGSLSCSRSLNHLSSKQHTPSPERRVTVIGGLEGDSEAAAEKVPRRIGSVEMLNALGDVAIPQLCSACSKKFLLSDMVVVFESGVFHVSCFCCGRCGGLVDAAGDFLILEDGLPLCFECSPACHACHEKIVTSHVGVLNKDFHESCLSCYQCKKSFSSMTKVYACAGEPCCAECITPVFDEAWSPHSSTKRTRSASEKEGTLPLENPRESDSQASLPLKLEALSQIVSDLSPSKKFHSLLRPSNSAPTLGNVSSDDSPGKMVGLSSLEAVLYDEIGASLFMSFCVEDCSIEQIVFWLDVEQFKQFEGDADDIKIFAHHIMLKYVGNYAELPLGLPKSLEDEIVSTMQRDPFDQDTFNEAQSYVYEHMEKKLLPRFLQSHEGQSYVETIISRDIDRRHKRRQSSSDPVAVVSATVTSFDKRHGDRKYYVYEIQVETEETKFMIYRRYDDFLALHTELRALFPRQRFPPLPKKKILSRSQTKAVAQQRMRDLQAYIQGVLGMSGEVSGCSTVRQFLKQTATDREDEDYNKKIMQVQRTVN